MTDDAQLSEAPNGTDSSLVGRVRAGDPDAFGLLYDRWFDRVHDLAYRVLYDAEAAADVAQDTFLSAWRNIGTLEDPGAFGGWLLRIARNAALNRKRNDDRSRPADEERLAVIEQARTRPEDRLGAAEDPARFAEDSELVGLLWSAAGALGERDREVLDLHLRHGLAPAEIADVVGLNRNAANQLVHRVRQRLAAAVGARVLWRGGLPACGALRAALEAADVDGFDADAVRVTERHAAGCTECEQRQRTHLSPAQMFSAVPFLAIPSLEARVAHALAADGVPMQGSATLQTPTPPRHGRLRRVLLGTSAGVLVVAAVIAVGATRAHEGELLVDELAAERATTTSAPASTTTASSTTTTTTGVTTTTRRIPVVPPTVAPATPAPTTTTTSAPTTTTTAPLQPVLALDVTPSSAPPSYPMAPGSAPALTWSAQDAPGVIVAGPNFRSTEASGSALVCPGQGSPSFCIAQPGDYVYTLEARDPTGKLIDKVDVILKIGT